MKKIIFILITLLVIANVKSQVINDDCYNAVYLGDLSTSANTKDCFDGTVDNDTFLITSNVNSLIDYPFYGMTGCYGYSNSNNIPSNDIWYKFKAESFILKIENYYNPTPIDTLHLNIWYGQDCDTLYSSCCYTFCGTPIMFFFSDTISGSSNSNDFVYLQFSGNRPNKFGSFAFCLTDISVMTPYCNSTPIIISALEEEFRINDKILVFPNPTNDKLNLSIEENAVIDIINIQGQIVYSKSLTEKSNSLDLSNLVSGVYTLKIKTDRGIAIRKLIKQ